MPNGPTLDGLNQPDPIVTAAPSSPAVAPTRNVKSLKLLLGGGAFFLYMIFAAWCGLLLMALPSPEQSGSLILLGVSSTLLSAVIFAGIGAFIFMHIAQSKAQPAAKQFALIKLGVVIIPGFVLACVTPYMITREPALTIAITQPTTPEELVAPVAISFDVSSTVEILSSRGFHPIQYRWDINGDKKIDQETLDPSITATYDREGVYTVSVVMTSSDGTTKGASKRFVIRTSVFSVTPNPAIVDQPTVLSLQHLFPQPETVLSVSWDFDGDGVADDQGKNLQVSTTFIRTGKQTVTATVQLSNKTQAKYERIIDVQTPPPLPFPVTVQSQPSVLVGTAPFAALFEVNTKEPLYGVQWNFGDGERADGPRVTHTFAKNGSFAVVAKVRSQSGATADVTTVVKVVDRLNLSDLRFEGTPQFQGSKITGEVPLTLDIRAVTQKPFVSFSWEAPDATEVGSTKDRLQAIYRRPGTYTITMIAQDLENHVLRQPITVEVLPPSSLITFRMEPEAGVAPLTVQFDASESTIPGEDITGFIWNFGDNSQEEYGGAITQHTYRLPGNYVVNLRATTTSGKQQGMTKTVGVRAPTVQARILASRLTGQAPLTVSFDASTSIGVISSYIWNFGDGTENDGKETEHTFLSAGVYTVQLTVTDSNGKTGTSSITITVN